MRRGIGTRVVVQGAGAFRYQVSNPEAIFAEGIEFKS